MKLIRQMLRQVPPRDEFEEEEELTLEERTSRDLHGVISGTYQVLENLGLRKRAYFCAYDIENEQWHKVLTPASNYVHASDEFEALRKFAEEIKVEQGVVVSRINIREPHSKYAENIYGEQVKIVDSETRSQDSSDWYNNTGKDLISYAGGKFFVEDAEVERENPIYEALDKIVYLEEGHIGKKLKEASERTAQQLRELGE